MTDYFVIGDVHGKYDMLMTYCKSGMVILSWSLGDLIDRGKIAEAVLES